MPRLAPEALPRAASLREWDIFAEVAELIIAIAEALIRVLEQFGFSFRAG